MRKIIKIYILAIATSMLPVAGFAAHPYKAFVASEYDSKQFSISESKFRNGSANIHIVHARKNIEAIQKDYQPPFCRAWLEVTKGKSTVFRKFYDDIESLGASFGLFVPKIQPPGKFFAVVKNGDYDGRLFMIRGDGKVFDLMGGFYFISDDKNFLFSSYMTDVSEGLAVFDLRKGKVVFSSKAAPSQKQWYYHDGEYFFTAYEQPDEPASTSKNSDFAYFYDWKLHKIRKKRIYPSVITASKPVRWDFDPREYEDCTATHDQPPIRAR